jgi:hypothetical protein
MTARFLRTQIAQYREFSSWNESRIEKKAVASNAVILSMYESCYVATFPYFKGIGKDSRGEVCCKYCTLII